MRSELSVLKRFWTSATAEETPDGWTVRLDARALRTPAKAPFLAPNAAIAAAAAAEWDAQVDQVSPASMPVTRYMNSAIDRVALAMDAVKAEIAAYGETDLLCYRAGHPRALAERQAAAWNPVLDWLRRDLNAPLICAIGVTAVSQPQDSLDRLADALEHDPFVLAAMWDVVGLTGSLGLGLALRRKEIDVDAAWRAARIDEDWQIEQWGADEEAAAHAAGKRRDLNAAAAFLEMV